MAEATGPDQTPLEAKSPFELRVNLGNGVPETDVRTALATGDMGFLHSYTTGSAVDGPGVRVVAWTTGCMWRCRYCHNPDTWTITNGLPVTVARAADELRKYRHGLQTMKGGFTLSGGEPLMQHRFAAKLLAASSACCWLWPKAVALVCDQSRMACAFSPKTTVALLIDSLRLLLAWMALLISPTARLTPAVTASKRRWPTPWKTPWMVLAKAEVLRSA